MGLLGMLAAGAASGLRDASNLQYKANLEMDREALRQEYYNRRASQRREGENERAKNTQILNEQKYARERADKLEDAKAGHKQKLELEEFKQGKADARTNRQIESRGGSGGDGSAGGKGLLSGKSTKPLSNRGKEVADMVTNGEAKDPNDAYWILSKRDATKELIKNPMFEMKPLAEQDKEIEKLARRLHPGKSSGSTQAVAPAVAKPEVSHSYHLDPKTGKLVTK